MIRERGGRKGDWDWREFGVGVESESWCVCEGERLLCNANKVVQAVMFYKYFALLVY